MSWIVASGILSEEEVVGTLFEAAQREGRDASDAVVSDGMKHVAALRKLREEFENIASRVC